MKIINDLIDADDTLFTTAEKRFITELRVQEHLTPTQKEMARRLWNSRLRGLKEYTSWNDQGDIEFDGKIYKQVLNKLAALAVCIEDDERSFSSWECKFIDDVYAKYHPSAYSKRTPSSSNPILSNKQMEHIERIYACNM